MITTVVDVGITAIASVAVFSNFIVYKLLTVF